MIHNVFDAIPATVRDVLTPLAYRGQSSPPNSGEGPGSEQHEKTGSQGGPWTPAPPTGSSPSWPGGPHPVCSPGAGEDEGQTAAAEMAAFAGLAAATRELRELSRRAQHSLDAAIAASEAARDELDRVYDDIVAKIDELDPSVPADQEALRDYITDRLKRAQEVIAEAVTLAREHTVESAELVDQFNAVVPNTGSTDNSNATAPGVASAADDPVPVSPTSAMGTVPAATAATWLPSGGLPIPGVGGLIPSLSGLPIGELVDALITEALDQEPDEVNPTEGTEVVLPGGEVVEARTADAAAAVREILDGVPIDEAYEHHGLRAPQPGETVTNPVDHDELMAGDVGVWSDQRVIALGAAKLLIGGQVRTLDDVDDTAPDFGGWVDPTRLVARRPEGSTASSAADEAVPAELGEQEQVA